MIDQILIINSFKQLLVVCDIVISERRTFLIKDFSNKEYIIGLNRAKAFKQFMNDLDVKEHYKIEKFFNQFGTAILIERTLSKLSRNY